MNLEKIFGCNEDNLPDLSKAKALSIDVETYDPDLKKQGAGVRRSGYIVGIAVAADPGTQSYYLPIRHDRGPNFNLDKVLSWAKRMFNTPRIAKIFANSIYDLDYLAQEGIEVTGPIRDIQIAEPLLNENLFSYTLENISQRRLKIGKREDEMDKWVLENLGKKAKTKENIYQIPSDVVAPYGRMDVELPILVYKSQKPELEMNDLWPIFLLESRLVPMLLAMKRQGVRVDLEKAEALRATLSELIDKAKNDLENLVKQEINIHAAASIAEACDKLFITYPLTAKTQKPSFTKKWMETQVHSGEGIAKDFFSHLLNLRQYKKFKNDFVENAILGQHVKGRIHCQFNQLKTGDSGAATGRLSSSHPNLQQIPSRGGDLAKQVRGLFIPNEKGHVWGKWDFKAIEPRVAINYAAIHKLPGAEEAAEFVRNNPEADIYQPMMDKLPDLSRSVIKMVYLGISYSMGPSKLAGAIEVSEDEARRIIKEFNKGVPYLKALSDMYISQADNFGYIETLMGRRRHFDNYIPKGYKNRKEFKTDAEFEKYKEENKPLLKEYALEKYGRDNIERSHTYKAFNALIQGSSADIMKKAMLDVWQSGICDEIGPPLLTVHDELDWSLPDTSRGWEIAEEITKIMENCVKLKVPLVVDAEFGPSWSEVK